MRQILIMLLLSASLAACGQATNEVPDSGQLAKPAGEAAPAGEPAPVVVTDPQNTIFLDTVYGRVVIQMRPDLAPKAVERIKTLTRKGFYNGLKFHRVLGGFMAQTGDPKGDGTGGSDLPDLKAEFGEAPFSRGALGMARSDSPDSANSQFFICYSGCGHLTGQYTLWGYVTSGMEYVEKLHRGNASFGGKVAVPDIIVKMQLAADAKK
jgi:peptidylprolyl isomerase